MTHATLDPLVDRGIKDASEVMRAHELPELLEMRSGVDDFGMVAGNGELVGREVESRTLDEYRDLLLGGEPTLTANDFAERSGISLEEVHTYLLEMGFAPSEHDQVSFTERDYEVFENWFSATLRAKLAPNTAASLARAQAHLTDRLALWEIEALVEGVERRLGLDDTSARVVAIDEMQQMVQPLEEQMVYAWRRRMYSLIERMTREIAARGTDHSKRRFPLSRSFGFVDMSSYTHTASVMGADLVGLVERFEYLCRTVVTSAGGRVVKMIGDSVFFIADDLETGLEVVTSLIDSLKMAEGILPVRASFIQGDVFSRSGDVFGPSVNLAARLVDIAPRWSILTDAKTATAIDSSSVRSEYEIQEFPSTELRGLGRVSPYRLRRVSE
ncbi:adenylate/guanylate cyclase domain-containing protein [Actinomyces minihominis]|uniref:adenylate/guanylate cyclase domain-containing protein n=1 Tax=Actinomyces minihominis TaxID=2002838 RepID=UPI001F5C7328|nr:adenylate/guanylate cyclase domain-containing protein [Actinomyces minihominis]